MSKLRSYRIGDRIPRDDDGDAAADADCGIIVLLSLKPKIWS